MTDRKKLQEELNRINQLYQEKDLEMRKIGGSTEQRQAMRDMLNIKKEQLTRELGDDLQQLNTGKGINVGKGTVSKVADTTGGVDAAKLAGLGKLKSQIGKKVAGILPFAGAGMAALSGDPAMAAEELATDAMGPAGMAYEALKPEVAGNPEEESMMLAERDAMENYKNSPAGQAAKLRKLKALMGGNNE